MPVPPPPVPTQLIVFADDWGRHPSSSQHLVRELLPNYPTLWVNTVGTRRPRLSIADARRAFGIARSWVRKTPPGNHENTPDGLTVISPRMYPGYRLPWQRRINDRSVSRAVAQHLLPGHRHIVLTTLPTTAGLPTTLDADAWVYYCVDDYSQWPGVDQGIMGLLERRLLERVDAIACVSESLRERILGLGRCDSVLLTHGVDQDMWQTPEVKTRLSPNWPILDKPVALFWGLLDERMDRDWSTALSGCVDVHAVFAGPLKIDPGHLFNADSLHLGPIAHHDLPAHAAAASVLIMPYIDAPVTRAMQPLKLLEYLATMKPVVVRDLPSTRAWADCCDLAISPGGFIDLVRERARTGILPEQAEARRRRLPAESWKAKAAQLASIINRGAPHKR